MLLPLVILQMKPWLTALAGYLVAMITLFGFLRKSTRGPDEIKELRNFVVCFILSVMLMSLPQFLAYRSGQSEELLKAYSQGFDHGKQLGRRFEKAPDGRVFLKSRYNDDIFYHFELPLKSQELEEVARNTLKGEVHQDFFKKRSAEWKFNFQIGMMSGLQQGLREMEAQNTPGDS